jgi:GTP-binding protein EngB required for normal cell division
MVFALILSLVTPGVLSTIAFFLEMKRLKIVDLPTLGLPTKATIITLPLFLFLEG